MLVNIVIGEFLYYYQDSIPNETHKSQQDVMTRQRAYAPMSQKVHATDAHLHPNLCAHIYVKTALLDSGITAQAYTQQIPDNQHQVNDFGRLILESFIQSLAPVQVQTQAQQYTKS